MPTAADIQRMRAAHDRRLPDRVDIRRKVLADDGMGGERETPVVIATGVPARWINQGARAVSVWASRINVTGDWRFTLPVEHQGQPLVVKEEDELLIHERTFTVVDSPDGQSWDISQVVGCMEVT